MAKFPGNTIQLSDTIDQWKRRVHINVRNDKVTMVYRWKSRADGRDHTQRMTLDDSQVGHLLASVDVASAVATGEDAARKRTISKVVSKETVRLSKASEAE